MSRCVATSVVDFQAKVILRKDPVKVAEAQTKAERVWSHYKSRSI